MSDNERFNELVKKAMAVFNSLSPEEQRAHRREQAISFAVGQALLSRFESGKPDLSQEDEDALRRKVAELYDQNHP